jgi:hypothetical protein
MPVSVLWNTRHLARAIAELPLDSPLPCRAALVPRSCVALRLPAETPTGADAELLTASILEKEQRIAEIMGHIQKLLAGGGS